MDDELILATMLKIQRYLHSNPESADTLDGVHSYWIQSPELKAITQAALERLENTGIVERMAYGRDNVLWRRPRNADGDANNASKT